MKNKKNICFVFFIFIFVVGCGKQKPPQHKKQEKFNFFYESPVVTYTKSGIPCIAISLEDKEITVKLDLGCCGCLHASSLLISKIKKKFYSGSRLTYGVKGKSYKNNVFLIRGLDIGNWFFSGKIPIEDGYGEGFDQDTVIYSEELTSSSLKEEGRVGWWLFEPTNLLLDMKHSKIAFCDSLETCQKHGYFLESFSSTPLLLDRGIVELKAQTSWGDLRCALDTGSTWNILNNKEAHEIFLDKIEKCLSFSVSDQELGPIEFYPFSIQLPIYVEAILGMDFFFDHLVFIDFHEKQIFISPYPKEDAKAENI